MSREHHVDSTGPKVAPRLQLIEQAAAAVGDMGTVPWGGRQLVIINSAPLIYEALVRNAASFAKSDFQMEVFGRGEEVTRALGNGLLTSSRETHQAQLRVLGQAFGSRALEAYIPRLADCTTRATARWAHERPFELSRECMRLAVDMVCRSLFKSDLGSMLDGVAESALATTNALGSSERHWDVAAACQLRHHTEFLHHVVDALIAGRRAQSRPGSRDDVLGLLLDEQGRQQAAKEGAGAYLLTDGQMHDEISTLLLAGSENPKNALTWTLYELARRPELASAIAREADAVRERHAVWSAAAVAELDLTARAFKEVLRVHPPAYAFGRVATRDVVVGQLPIAAGSEVLFSPYALHRRRDYYRAPESFDLDHFSPQAMEKRPRGAFMPFGVGERACIGGLFAIQQGVLATAQICQQFELTLINPELPVTALPRITLRPREEVFVIATPRQASQSGPRSQELT